MTAQPGRPWWRTASVLFFVVLFAFVLPFVCWGAQATPGHPHARAHFVFLPPAPVDQAHHDAQSSAAGAGHAHPYADTDLPAGKATPSVLAISLLLLIALAALSTLPDDPPAFVRWQPVLRGRRTAPPRVVPPPRRARSAYPQRWPTCAGA